MSSSQISWLEEKLYQKHYTGLINNLVGFTKWHSYKNKPNFCHLQLRKKQNFKSQLLLPRGSIKVICSHTAFLKLALEDTELTIALPFLFLYCWVVKVCSELYGSVECRPGTVSDLPVHGQGKRENTWYDIHLNACLPHLVKSCNRYIKGWFHILLMSRISTFSSPLKCGRKNNLKTYLDTELGWYLSYSKWTWNSQIFHLKEAVD